MTLLAEVKGQNGILFVFKDYIEISRKSLGGFSSQGGKGNRKIYYTDISSIEYKTPTLFGNGYFKVIISGTRDINAGVGLLSSSMSSMKDSSTVVLRAFKKSTSDKCDLAYTTAFTQLDACKRAVTLSFNHLDELKKLGDLLNSGILTVEEFEREKAKLLINV